MTSVLPIDAIRNLTGAWMRKDAAEMSRWLTPDILEIGPAFPEALSGQKHFFARYRPYLHGRIEVVTYSIRKPQTTMLGRRLALVHFQYRMRTRNGKVVETSSGKESMLVQRLRGRWRVRYIHWHRDR